MAKRIYSMHVLILYQYSFLRRALVFESLVRMIKTVTDTNVFIVNTMYFLKKQSSDVFKSLRKLYLPYLSAHIKIF